MHTLDSHHDAIMPRHLATLLLLGACTTAPPPLPTLTAPDLGDAIDGHIGVFSRRGDAEQAPPEVPRTVILDTVLLVTRAPQTCFEVTLNTEASYDRAFGDLSPRCEVDGRPRRPTIERERHNTASYEFERWAGLLEKTQHIFPSVTRVATLCCPEPASSRAELTLSNPTFGDRDDQPWTLRAQFTLEPPQAPNDEGGAQ